MKDDVTFTMTALQDYAVVSTNTTGSYTKAMKIKTCALSPAKAITKNELRLADYVSGEPI